MPWPSFCSSQRCSSASRAPLRRRRSFAPADGYGFGVGAAMTWMSTVDADRELDAVARNGGMIGYSGPAFIYSIRDLNTANPDSDQDNFGALLTTDWQPKLASIVLAR